MFRLTHLRLCWLLLPAALLAQPVAPFPYPVPGPRSRVVLAPQVATVVPLTVNTSSREEVRQFYRAIYSASDNVPIGWTGDYATGNAGDTTAAFKEAVRLRINFFRALVGIPAAVTLNSSYSTEDQQAALMMSGNNTLQHTGIPTSWKYYTAAGADAAANSNLALGATNYGPNAITDYMSDSGSNNSEVGHRRWLEYPQTQQMGTGDVPGNNTLNGANATWVIDSNYGGPRPVTRTTQVTYPPAGYVPYTLVWPRWSFSYPNADFSSATVTMSLNGQPVAAAIEPPSTVNVGEPTLVWVYNGLDGTAATTHPKPASDTTYSVTVANVRIGGAAQNFSYNVTVFDPDVAGSDYTPVAVSGSGSPTIGSATPYSVTLPAFVNSFDWRSLQLSAFATTYDAEAGLNGITAVTSSGYPVVQNVVVGSGTAAFHLAHPNPPSDQSLTLPDTLLVTTNTAALTFLSELGWATSSEVAHVQASVDEGLSWTDVYTQAGTGGSGESGFVARSASLASFQGRTIRLRFVYTVSNSYFPQTDPGVGWYLDNIAAAGVQRATAGASTHVAGATTFSFTPASAGAAVLQARGVLFGAYPLEWGLVDAVTPTGDTGPNTTYLSNLSVRTTAGTDAQTLIVGFTIRGGSKQLLIRGIGPTLSQFAVDGVLADPRLDVYLGQTLLLGNDNWDSSDASTFTAVGAFPLPNGSKDAAIVTTLDANGYTAQVSGIGGTTGTALVELYDVSGTGNGARLFNVSARSQVGTGNSILIAGFTVAGSGQRKLLIRGIGPTLAQYGVSGVLLNPDLALFTLSGTKLQENDDWGGGQAIADAATSVGAFALPVNSLDSSLIVTLPPGAYTAQVSGVGGTTGVALVEVYELP